MAQSGKKAGPRGWGGGQGPARTTLGPVLFVAVDEQEAGALGAEGQQDALQQGRDEDDAQQQGPQLLVAHEGVQAEDLGEAGTEEAAGRAPRPAPLHPVASASLCPQLLYRKGSGSQALPLTRVLTSLNLTQLPHL